MNTERKTPLLCLKLNVNRALYNGEKISLDECPVKKDGKTLIPTYVLELLDTCASDVTDGYFVLESVEDICYLENEMGLIFFDTEPVTLCAKKDLAFILELTHSFIFEVDFERIGGEYAPATDKERDAFLKLGTKIRELLLKRNNRHPFLFGSDKIFDRLREIYNSKDQSEAYKYIAALIERADKHLSAFPALNEKGDGLVSEIPMPQHYGEDAYDIGGRHSDSEYLLEKLLHGAFAYMMTYNTYYAKHTYYCALSVINRPHWGPGHFLNCSGAAGRLAMIYDWLYNAWTELKLDTGSIKRGIYDQGLHHGINSVIYDKCDFPSKKQGTGWRFKLKPDNWNSVCNSGMIIGSLCLLAEDADDVISEEEYKNITELLGGCMTSTLQPHLVYHQYAPDGSYVESNSYWAYGTVNLMNTMAALYDSLGTDLGMHHGCGLDRTCYYAINTESSEFVGWNYHDGGLGRQDTASFNQFATMSGDDLLYSLRLDHLRRGKEVALFDMMYYPTVRHRSAPKLESMPLDYAMIGIDAFTVRSGWEKGSLFAGMIGGENPGGASHNQLDSGAFVYHNLGRLWFTDLGSDYYNSKGKRNGLGYFSDYELYRRNAEGNNCLCLTSLPYGQLLGGRGVMTRHNSSDTASYCIIDNTEIYGKDKVESAKRGMLLINGRKTLIIKDEVRLVTPETAFTTAHFESDNISAAISEDGRKCTLTHKEGGKIFVTLVGDGKLSVMDCDKGLLKGTYPAEGEHTRERFSRLVVMHENTQNINTSFIIDTENSEYDIPDIDMWETL